MLPAVWLTAAAAAGDAWRPRQVALLVELSADGADVVYARHKTSLSPERHMSLHPPRERRWDAPRDGSADVHLLLGEEEPVSMTFRAPWLQHAHGWDEEEERFAHGHERSPSAVLQVVLPDTVQHVVVADDDSGLSHHITVPSSAEIASWGPARRGRRASPLGYWDPPRHKLIDTTLEYNPSTGGYDEVPLQRGGPTETQQNLVFLSGGYVDGPDAEKQFRIDLDYAVRILQSSCDWAIGDKRACSNTYNDENTNNLRRSAPYRRYFSSFNVFAVFEPSREAGASVPTYVGTKAQLRNGTILPTPVKVDNNLGCSYGTTVVRALYCNPALVQALADTAPCGAIGAENVVVVTLVKAPLYGGSASYRPTVRVGSFSTGYFDLQSPSELGSFGSLLIHELGHCYNNLLDEYDTGTSESAHKDIPNCHWNDDPDDVPWKGWIDLTLGGFNFPLPGGGTHHIQDEDQKFYSVAAKPLPVCGWTNWFQPSPECLMEKLTSNGVVPRLCPVCREASYRMIYRTGLDISYPKCPLNDEHIFITNSSGSYIFVNGEITAKVRDKDGGLMRTAWHCKPTGGVAKLTVACSGGGGAAGCLGVNFPRGGSGGGATRSRTFVVNSTTVNALSASGAAARAGVTIGMSVAEVDGKAVATADEADAALGAGDHTVVFSAWRSWWAPPSRPGYEFDVAGHIKVPDGGGALHWEDHTVACDGCSAFVYVTAADMGHCGSPSIDVRVTITDETTWVMPENRPDHPTDMHRNMVQNYTWTVELAHEPPTGAGFESRTCISPSGGTDLLPTAVQPPTVRAAISGGMVGATQLSYTMKCKDGGTCTVEYSSRPLPQALEYQKGAVDDVETLVFGLPGLICILTVVIFMLLWLLFARSSTRYKTARCVYVTKWDRKVSIVRKTIMAFGLLFMMVASSCIGYGMHLYKAVGPFLQLLLIAGFILAVCLFVAAFSGTTAAFYRSTCHLYVNGSALVLCLVIMGWLTYVVAYVGDNIDRDCDDGSAANTSAMGMDEVSPSCTKDVALCGIEGVGCGLKEVWSALVQEYPEKVCAFQDELECSGYTLSCQRQPSSDFCPSGCDDTNMMYGDACKVKLQDDIARNCRRLLPIMYLLTFMMACAMANNFALACMLTAQEKMQKGARQLGLAEQRRVLKQRGRANALLSSLSDDQRHTLITAFMEADSDGSGTLNERELAAFLRATVARDLSDDEVTTAFRTCDIDRDGRISFEDFVAAFNPKKASTPGPDAADGDWFSSRSGKKVSTIRGNVLTWARSGKTVAVKKAAGVVSIQSRGQTLTARVEMSILRWSDGDVWVRAGTPPPGPRTPALRTPEPRTPQVPVAPVARVTPAATGPRTPAVPIRGPLAAAADDEVVQTESFAYTHLPVVS